MNNIIMKLLDFYGIANSLEFSNVFTAYKETFKQNLDSSITDAVQIQTTQWNENVAGVCTQSYVAKLIGGGHTLYHALL